jgi:hypothetical protein
LRPDGSHIENPESTQDAEPNTVTHAQLETSGNSPSTHRGDVLNRNNGSSLSAVTSKDFRHRVRIVVSFVFEFEGWSVDNFDRTPAQDGYRTTQARVNPDTIPFIPHGFAGGVADCGGSLVFCR